MKVQHTRTLNLHCLLFNYFSLLNLLIRGISSEELKGINSNCVQRQRAFSGSALSKSHSSVLPYYSIIILLHFECICHIYESRTIQGI